MASVATQSLNGGFASGAISNTASATSGTSAGSLLNMNSFLTMFTTQLKYQDPSNPLESYELSAQLAQFSTVEQLAQISSQLKNQQMLLTAVNNAQMMDALGKEVVGSYDALQVKDGSISKGSYQLSAPADVTVRIYDDQGNQVRTISMGSQEAAQYSVTWDGKNDSGETMGDGSYTFDVSALDTQGNSVDVTKSISGRACAFRVEDGAPYLVLDNTSGVKLPVSAIVEVDETTAA
ncbi:MAG: flagellar hook assembly protein FlgD [Syntrophobacteraceae bacterium]